MSIIVPRHLTEQPVFFCTLCDSQFYEDERHQYERHVLSHPLEEVQSHCPEFQAPGIFGRKSGDQEWAEWVERHRISDPHGFARWGRTDDGKHSSGVGDG